MPARRRKSAPRRRGASAKARPKRWSAQVTQGSDALDLKSRVFAERDPKKVARSLKRSAEHSTRRKGTPYQSAMSMLNFYINRAGRNLPAAQKKTLTAAKNELRKLFGRA